MNTKSKNPSKQRLKIYKGAMHTKNKLLVAPLDKFIIGKVGKQRLIIRKGDTVKVLVGDHKGKTGKIERVDHDKAKVYIKDIKNTNSRGQDKLIPFVASNLVITNAVLDDNRRINKKVESAKVVK
jgi:large subunit ribosomal protein L24